MFFSFCCIRFKEKNVLFLSSFSSKMSSFSSFFATDVEISPIVPFETFYHKREFFRNILRLDILKSSLKTLYGRELWLVNYELSLLCERVNDITRHEKKKKRSASKVFESREASNGGKQKTGNEVWSLGFFSYVFQHQLNM